MVCESADRASIKQVSMPVPPLILFAVGFTAVCYGFWSYSRQPETYVFTLSPDPDACRPLLGLLLGLAPRRGVQCAGGRFINCSKKGALAPCERRTGRKMDVVYNESNRIGDHIWYISEARKFRSHDPAWRQTYAVYRMVDQIFESMSSPHASEGNETSMGIEDLLIGQGIAEGFELERPWRSHGARRLASPRAAGEKRGHWS
jgi:hypothetical protein